MNRRTSLLLLAMLLPSCSEDARSSGGDDAGRGGADAANAAPRFRLGGKYDLAAGEETNLCARVNLEEELLVTGLAPVRGEGTHHVIAAIDPTPEEPGVTPCEAFGLDWVTLFAASIGSPALTFPEGVALRLPRGSQLMLQMHVVNPSDVPLTGAESAVDLTLAEPEAVEHEADVALVGPLDISIGAAGGTETASCTMREATNYFAVFPHMHSLGRHARVWVTQAGANRNVHDAAFDPDAQLFVEFEPIPLAKGDTIGVECTYAPPRAGTAPIAFGPFTDDEMCFAVSYRYPASPLTLGSLCYD
ncbi:MAG: hypothetical protein FJ104_11890 [Deltaproteobacteria bacterium]|nr:hypothetical protein [Deltaproteobacteria bacterium]